MYYPMFYDPTYILIIIGVFLSLAASAKVNSTFARYAGVRNRRGITGQMAAEQFCIRPEFMMCRYREYPVN